jgi:hypothetical protein
MKLQSKEGKWVGEDGLTAKSSVRKNGFAQKNIDGEMFEAIVSDEDDTSSRLYFTTSHSELVDKLVSNKQYAEFLSETGTELKFFKQMSIINKPRILSDFFDLYSFLELTEEDIYPLEDVIAFIDEDNSAIKKS